MTDRYYFCDKSVPDGHGKVHIYDRRGNLGQSIAKCADMHYAEKIVEALNFLARRESAQSYEEHDGLDV
jgi:hypothetical protein